MTSGNFIALVALSFIVGLHAAFMVDASPYKKEKRLIIATAVISILIMLYAFMKV
jgi:hypothetical protein